MLSTPIGVPNNPDPTTTDSSTYSAARGAKEVNGNWQDGTDFVLACRAALIRLQVLEFALKPIKICDCRYQSSFHAGAAISSPRCNFSADFLQFSCSSCFPFFGIPSLLLCFDIAIIHSCLFLFPRYLLPIILLLFTHQTACQTKK